jgi:hypothetical protein
VQNYIYDIESKDFKLICVILVYHVAH